jgi:hypothetical protein
MMPAQNLAKMTKTIGDPDYWANYAQNLPPKAKTRGAAAVATEMEIRGEVSVTEEIKAVIEKAVALAGGI